MEYEGISIPDTVELQDESNKVWAEPLFLLVSGKCKSPKDIWDYVEAHLFKHEELTTTHHYVICTYFAAIMAVSHVTQYYEEQLHSFSNILQSMQESETEFEDKQKRIILPY